MTTKTINVPNISCGHCVSAIEDEVGSLGGVIDVHADLATKQVTINWDAPANWEKITTLLEEIGYPPSAN
jgi:copper ion binding protein